MDDDFRDSGHIDEDEGPSLMAFDEVPAGARLTGNLIMGDIPDDKEWTQTALRPNGLSIVAWAVGIVGVLLAGGLYFGAVGPLSSENVALKSRLLAAAKKESELLKQVDALQERLQQTRSTRDALDTQLESQQGEYTSTQNRVDRLEAALTKAQKAKKARRRKRRRDKQKR